MMARFSDPFEALLNMQRALDRSKLSDWLGHTTTSHGSYPPVNVFQQGDDLVVTAEIPGVKKEDLDISIKRNQLRISGKKEVDYGENLSIHRQERTAGSFDRTFNLPQEIESNDVKAELKDGVLSLFLPRAEKDRAKSISIE
jgi:HSP20 family protein